MNYFSKGQPKEWKKADEIGMFFGSTNPNGKFTLKYTVLIL
jgi:hypothetical protein